MAGEYARLIISGRVQGVGYRAWFAREAERRGLTGWVRNRRDGSVEALVAADTATLGDLVAACRQGPSAARVFEIEILAAGESDIALLAGVTVLPTA
ncbi:acylphosphatase [Ancylobacter amanitiformis]|uniref:acylphosphatase n=1 Tax=Ancylobacter amanitiformis TaxID=217069 RepID=A0ABU0LPK7_9HYPH|nr:acylphosphatase [Ancylobacter amanitiformis]MDQ0510636.1 acylphosphatase [Ancylobacter amanitiformis]